MAKRAEGSLSRCVRAFRTMGLPFNCVLLLAASAHAGVLDVSLVAPTTNSDGSALTSLAGYRVYYSTSPSPCPGATFVEIPIPTLSRRNQTIHYQLSGLSTGSTYSVAVTAVYTGGKESACSAVSSAVARGQSVVAPTGTVSFSADGAPIAACQNVALSATQTAACTVQGSALGGGVHSIGARYSGDGRVAGSSGSVAQEVTGGPTNMVAQEAILQLSPLSVNLLTLKATLTSATTHAGVTGQTVVFTAGGSTLCTATTNSAGLASCSILTNVSADVATITADGYKATFAGSADWLASSGSSGLIG